MRGDELTVGIAFILSSVLPVALALLWRGGSAAWRRLRNQDELERAERGQRIAIKMACTSQEAAKASQEQLTVCRGLLAAVMRERDYHERAVEVLARKLARIESERRKEKHALRYWLTRTIEPRKVSEN